MDRSIQKERLEYASARAARAGSPRQPEPADGKKGLCKSFAEAHECIFAFVRAAFAPCQKRRKGLFFRRILPGRPIRVSLALVQLDDPGIHPHPAQAD